MHYALVLLALGGLLALHELGHLVAARLLGVRVPRFVFGFGPPMASFRLGGTQFVVGAVPLGATVHIQGMNPHRADASEAASFQTLGPVRRALIILAGPLTNYLFALGVLFALYTSGTHVVVPMTVGTVKPGSEAARAQLLPGDRIDMVDGQSPRTWTEFVEKVAVGVGRSLDLRVERAGEARTVTVRPRPDERGEGRIGVSQQYVYRTHAPGEALRHAVVHTMNIASEGVTMFMRLARGDQPHGGPTGPGALVRQESSDAASSGLDSVLRALVAASVALALLTLLPVPGLDGGRVLLLMIEAVSGRRLPPRVETLAQTVGFLAISAVIVVVAATEIRTALPERFKTKPATASTEASAQGPGVPAATGPGGTAAPASPGGSAVASPGTTTATPVLQTGTTGVAPAAGATSATPSSGVGSASPSPANIPGTTPAALSPAAGIAPAVPASTSGATPATPSTLTGTPAPSANTPGAKPATSSPAAGVAPATATSTTGASSVIPAKATGAQTPTPSPSSAKGTSAPGAPSTMVVAPADAAVAPIATPPKTGPTSPSTTSAPTGTPSTATAPPTTGATPSRTMTGATPPAIAPSSAVPPSMASTPASSGAPSTSGAPTR
ncbi:M50 family metallopeptidase [Myxococcus stipitatus]|uniref:M50 family metallopeptidase n=1 Tax=Myxococcus stipitatus TaxID=83455 RepID=UPI0030CFA290